MALLQDTFLGRLISCRGDINWPQRSCNRLFCGAMRKTTVMQINLQFLKTNIRQVMAEISLYMCQKVVENYFKRINVCNTSSGGHLNEVVFHNRKEISGKYILHAIYLRLILEPQNE